jgi:hypothetical protein
MVFIKPKFYSWNNIVCILNMCNWTEIHSLNDYLVTPRNSQSHSVVDASRSTKMVSASVDVESMENGEAGRSLSSTDSASNSQDEEPSVLSTYRRSSKPSTLLSTTVPPQPSSISVLPVPPVVCTSQNLMIINYMCFSLEA